MKCDYHCARLPYDLLYGYAWSYRWIRELPCTSTSRSSWHGLPTTKQHFILNATSFTNSATCKCICRKRSRYRVNCLPSTVFNPKPLRWISWSSYLQSTPFWNQFYVGCDELYHYYPKHASARTYNAQASTIRVSCICNSMIATIDTSCTSWGYYNAIDRPKLQYIILRPCRRRWSCSIPTPILNHRLRNKGSGLSQDIRAT